MSLQNEMRSVSGVLLSIKFLSYHKLVNTSTKIIPIFGIFIIMHLHDLIFDSRMHVCGIFFIKNYYFLLSKV